MIDTTTAILSCGGRWSDKLADIKPTERVAAHRRVIGAGDQIAFCSLKSEISFLDKPLGEPPLFVSYYTENTPYEQYAHQLAQSLDHYGLPHRIESIPSLGSWVANTGLKAAIIEKIWNESDRPICWIDADAEIIRTPSFVFGSPFDVAFVRRHGWYDLAGFIYLNKSEPARQLITEWARLCRENQHVWDQVLLSLAWYRTAQSFDLSSYFLNDGIFRFPRPYIRDIRDKIFYYSSNKKIKPFINQKQASRKLKEFINSSRDIGREYTSNDIGDGFKVSLAEFKLQEIKGVTSIFR